jgi:SNF2 family DNA or RNA helicase
MSSINSTIETRMEIFTKYLDRTGMEHKQYQFEGLRWCLLNELRENPLYNVRGGFIADEMGLGKTILMIGLMLCNRMERTLIVLPPVLLEQWNSQILRTTGHKAIIYHGANKKKITLEMLEKAKIVITTYGAVASKVNNLLHKVKWSRVVYDEAHHLRNRKTQLYASAQMIQSNVTWLVSGTPVQNNKKDFYNLCSILKIPVHFYTDVSLKVLFKQHFLLKRTKQEVGIQMPELSLNKEIVGWSNQNEMELSESIHKNDGPNKLLSILLSRQSCIMPKLLENHTNHLEDCGITKEKMVQKSCSKLQSVVQQILERKGNGCGKLVFCHFRQEIDQMSKMLREGGIESIATFDGRVKQSSRKNILNSNAEVLILQIQTGCEGLNLQENYSEIYFVSPHWNPAVEEQAIARCHRIGQTKPVIVTRFIMGDFVDEKEREHKQEEEDEQDKKKKNTTIENYMLRVQNVKRDIMNSILSR